MKKKNPPIIIVGTAILNDFESTINTAKPPAIQNIAVRVPDANILLTTNNAMIMKNHLFFFIFVVMPKMRNAIAEAAALHP